MAEPPPLRLGVPRPAGPHPPHRSTPAGPAPSRSGTVQVELAEESTHPHAFAWSWVAAMACDDHDLTELVDRLPTGLDLLPGAVIALADELAGPSAATRGPAHAALLAKLDPQRQGCQDLATLIATAPDADPVVLRAALALLAGAGHPTRAVVFKAARDALRRDPRRSAYALAVVSSLRPVLTHEEAALVEPSATPEQPAEPAARGTRGRASEGSPGGPPRRSRIADLWRSARGVPHR